MNYSKELSKFAEEAFKKAGFSGKYGRITVSNRPDLCEYQCNGALAAAKEYHTAPIQIAQKVLPFFRENSAFSMAEAVAPGFINLNVSSDFLTDFITDMASSQKYGAELPEKQTIIIDYGGPNIAKPLHIGHLRSAVIGEAIKRMLRYMGHTVIGDIHLGDWGLPIGLIAEELKERRPELPYFDPEFKGEYPEDAPFTVSELEEIYPAASKRSKEDEVFRENAQNNTYLLQNGEAGMRALWKHIIDVSVRDLKKNYDRLNVYFDLWKAESDAQPYIPDMVKDLEDRGLAYVSEGALVVDVAEEGDKTEVPPCLIRKSDGASLYQTTDLATIIDRMKTYGPDAMIYLTDKRQELHFRQVFRVARKAQYVKPGTGLTHIGFGTMNGKDGKPFKTRDGGVMRLEYLIHDINEAVREKMKERYDEDECDEKTIEEVGLAAIKYGDLSNQASKDYNFDIDRFASFEGNTGPYILYTIVRIKSILRKADDAGQSHTDFECLRKTDSAPVRQLMRTLASFPEMIGNAAEERAPHKVCGYIYQLSDAFNSFYHETQILKEEDTGLKEAYLSILQITRGILEDSIDMLGFSAPDRM